MAETVDRLCALPARKLAKLRGRGRLFVHVTDEALRTRTGVARVEGVGPIDVRQLHEVLGHADVTVTPVLDLRMRRRVDAYEHPETVKDHVWVQTGGDCFPFTPRSATRDGVDYDHAVPYDDTGPPGQTGPHNSGPLRRRHHRTKTHGGLTTRVVGPGRHLWRTPHGQAFLVDHTGTTRLTEDQAAAMAEAIEDGVELYFHTPVELRASLTVLSARHPRAPVTAWPARRRSAPRSPGWHPPRAPGPGSGRTRPA